MARVMQGLSLRLDENWFAFQRPCLTQHGERCWLREERVSRALRLEHKRLA